MHICITFDKSSAMMCCCNLQRSTGGGMAFFGFLAAAGAVLGVLVMAAGLFGASGAPQQAATAAIAMAFAVLPYVFFRVIQLSNQAAELKAIRALLESRGEALPALGVERGPMRVAGPAPVPPSAGAKQWALFFTGIMALVIVAILIKAFKLA